MKSISINHMYTVRKVTQQGDRYHITVDCVEEKCAFAFLHDEVMMIGEQLIINDFGPVIRTSNTYYHNDLATNGGPPLFFREVEYAYVTRFRGFAPIYLAVLSILKAGGAQNLSNNERDDLTLEIVKLADNLKKDMVHTNYFVKVKGLLDV